MSTVRTSSRPVKPDVAWLEPFDDQGRAYARIGEGPWLIEQLIELEPEGGSGAAGYKLTRGRKRPDFDTGPRVSEVDTRGRLWLCDCAEGATGRACLHILALRALLAKQQPAVPRCTIHDTELWRCDGDLFCPECLRFNLTRPNVG